MNDKQTQILRLCAKQPMTTRQLVNVTGDTPSSIKARLHLLVKAGALTHSPLKDKYGSRLYQAAPDWQPKRQTELTTYRPLGLCVFGVWL